MKPSSRHLFVVLAILLAACDPPGQVNPPTEPAQPIQGPGTSAPPPQRPPGMEPMLRGAGATSFIGRWAATADACAQAGDHQAVLDVTTTDLHGRGLRCALETINERGQGYDALLACETATGRTERHARFEATDDSLRLMWLHQPSEQPMRLIRCTALAR
ncbi:hypothetical protein [Brevundimonas sp.]|uniref:hypothetical protein n=1 Tax=Brevundimonas sp. TaxID=1871086 RepID=UPI0028A9F0CA|nr:hypothetical protein [Brevundimonas sp.]